MAGHDCSRAAAAIPPLRFPLTTHLRGKRAEPVSPATTWYPQRNQLWRNAIAGDMRRHANPRGAWSAENGWLARSLPSCLAQTVRPAEIEQKVWIGEIKNLFLFVPIDGALIWELLLREPRHVKGRARDA